MCKKIQGPDWGNWVSEGTYWRDAQCICMCPSLLSLTAGWTWGPGAAAVSPGPGRGFGSPNGGSRAIPAQTCSCSWHISLAGLRPPPLISAWGPGWALSLAQLSHLLCRNSSTQSIFCTHLLAEAAADRSQSELLTRLPFPRQCVITGSGSEFIQFFAQISSAPFHAAHVTRHTTALSHAAGSPR